jgi:hypothetical protein
VCKINRNSILLVRVNRAFDGTYKRARQGSDLRPTD